MRTDAHMPDNNLQKGEPGRVFTTWLWAVEIWMCDVLHVCLVCTLFQRSKFRLMWLMSNKRELPCGVHKERAEDSSWTYKLCIVVMAMQMEMQRCGQKFTKATQNNHLAYLCCLSLKVRSLNLAKLTFEVKSHSKAVIPSLLQRQHCWLSGSLWLGLRHFVCFPGPELFFDCT